MKLNLNRTARAVLGAGLLASAALLTACGGSGEQEQQFYASRVLAFGDEFSVINANGTKYSVNGLATGSTTQTDCTVNPIWVQTLAASYGLAFPECRGTNTADPVSRIYAANQAKVADLSAQIDAYLANGGFAKGDMATVLVGANDVVAQFQQYPAVGEEQLAANATAAGTALADQVNRLAGYGVKVLIVTIPDMGLTPFAGARTATSTNPNATLLTRLSLKFNDALLANILNDGHKIGLVQLDEYLKAIDTATLRQYSGAPYSNTTQPACTVALPNCTTGTLVAGATTSAWLWADDRHLGATGQGALASLTLTREQNNPF
jgi:hypothetical protein